MENQKLDLRGVELDFGRPLEEFITPDWVEIFERYPEWYRRAEKAGLTKSSRGLSAFILLVCKDLERQQVRPGRTASEWSTRLMQHFGGGWVGRQVKVMQKVVQ